MNQFVSDNWLTKYLVDFPKSKYLENLFALYLFLKEQNLLSLYVIYHKFVAFFFPSLT